MEACHAELVKLKSRKLGINASQGRELFARKLQDSSNSVPEFPAGQPDMVVLFQNLRDGVNNFMTTSGYPFNGRPMNLTLEFP